MNVNISKMMNISEINGFLSNDDMSFLNKIKNDIVKSRSATGRYMIRKYLSLMYPDTFLNYSISYSDTGKPNFKDLPDFHFNISHSDDIVTAICSDMQCGIDIQEVSKYRPEIVKRFFHPTERFYLDNQSDDIQTEEFYHFWTAKESYVKYTGLGISSGLSNFYYDKNSDCIFNEKKKISAVISSNKIQSNGKLFYISICYKHLLSI